MSRRRRASEATRSRRHSPPQRRLNAQDKALRRKRIFARQREGWAYDEIAREERLTTERVREIVNEVLLWRRAGADRAHAPSAGQGRRAESGHVEDEST